MCRPIIDFSQAVYIIDPGIRFSLAGYQPAWAMWYIVLIPQALVLCLIYTHTPSGLRPSGLCVYIRQSTRACGISITYIYGSENLISINLYITLAMVRISNIRYCWFFSRTVINVIIFLHIYQVAMVLVIYNIAGFSHVQ